MLQKKKTGFVIFGQGRSGSTLLKQLFHSHPKVNCEGELLNILDNYVTHPFLVKVVNKFPLQYFSYRRMISKLPVYGFTLLHYQIADHKKKLSKMQTSGWKVIHLFREDTFEQCLSHFVAKQTDLWHRRTEKTGAIPSIYIDPHTFTEWHERLVVNKKLEDEFLKGIVHERVSYENDLLSEERWPETMKRLFGFMGIDYSPVSASLKRTYKKPYSEIVENYKELLEKVEQSTVILND